MAVDIGSGSTSAGSVPRRLIASAAAAQVSEKLNPSLKWLPSGPRWTGFQ